MAATHRWIRLRFYRVHHMHLADIAAVHDLQAQEKAMEQQQNMMARQQSMQAIESEHANLQSEVETRESTVKEATHHVEELQRQLLVSKQRVDLAQARKEEVGPHPCSHAVVLEKPAGDAGRSGG